LNLEVAKQILDRWHFGSLHPRMRQEVELLSTIYSFCQRLAMPVMEAIGHSIGENGSARNQIAATEYFDG
jgi:hypothetical protein